MSARSVATIDEISSMVALQLGRRRALPEDRFVEDLGAESMDLVNIVARVEERYGIAIDEEELAELATVAQLHACVEEKIGASAGDG